MPVKTYSLAKDGATQLSKNFKVREFACHDGSDTILIDSDLVTLLQKIRDKFGKSITINSAYRTKTYNAKIGGASNSQHTKGKAADIVIHGVTINEIAQAAEELGARGIGRYDNKGFVHVDVRETKYFWIQKSSGVTPVSSFGAKDYSAMIRKFQAWLNQQHHANLICDGIYGAKTKVAAKKVYDKGNNTDAVYILQGMLYCLGYNPNGIDGKYGAGCTEAVKQFQKDNGLTVDGKAGSKTFAKLFK